MLKFRVSLLSLALLLGASAAVPAVAKTPAVTAAAAQPRGAGPAGQSAPPPGNPAPLATESASLIGR